MSDKLVSIVLPTYNRSSLLAEAVESCLEQTHRNIELIIVDDGSTDGTRTTAEAYADRDTRVRYYYKENGRLPRALNYGFERTRGDYLTWTSDDNRYLPDAVEEMLDFLESHPDIGMVYCDYYMQYHDKDFCKVKRLPFPPRLESGNDIGACFLYRREVLDRVGEYDPDMELAEDYDYWMRISKEFGLGHIERPLYVYGYHHDALYHKFGISARIAGIRACLKNSLMSTTELDGRLKQMQSLASKMEHAHIDLDRRHDSLVSDIHSIRGVFRRIVKAVQRILRKRKC